MGLLTVLSTFLCWICQPVEEEAQSSLRGAAQDLFSYLRGWLVRGFNARRNAVVAVNVDSAPLVGADETIQEILNHLRDDKVGIIGIYGMGGIGKTTLLREINNHLLKNKASRGNFNVVIRVTVPKEVSISNIRQNQEHNDLRIPKIQKQIGDRLRISFIDSQPTVDRANLLFKALSEKRSLLLLDDLWEKLDLVEVGIPDPKRHKNCKVAFTTRSLQVCAVMEANQKVCVKLLNKAQSWELFCSKLQDALQNPSLRPLARQVVNKCGGLPLALITVGRAMANRQLPEEWKHAINALDHSANDLQGMDKVISCLKFSYDCLENDNMRSALLYCAMYPEDYKIHRRELIDHWIGEGLLDVRYVDEPIDDVRNRGHVLISDLQHACLLEAGVEDPNQLVGMHDAVRDLALWINNDDDEVGKVDGFYLLNATPATMTQSRGKLIRRIWVRNSDLEEVPHYLKDANICTLRMTSFQSDKAIKPSLLQDFLIRSKRTLRVLDLSYSLLKELPVEEIGSLPELRYLNLGGTPITSLPIELGGLFSLRQLELQETTDLVEVPREAIARLTSLQVLNLCDAGLDWDTQIEMKDSGRCEGSQQHSNLADDVEGEGGRQLQLKDLDDLGRLQDLRIRLRTSQSLEWILNSKKLWRCIRCLGLEEGWNYHLLWKVFHKMGRHLRELILTNMYSTWEGELRLDLNELPCLELLSLEGLSGNLSIAIVGRNGGVTDTSSGPSLKQLLISLSYGWKELKFVGRFPSLEEIGLSSCPEMEELTLDDDDGFGTGGGESQGLLDSHFPMLREMELVNLPALTSVGRQPLLFPSLQTIKLMRCPELKRLPLGPSSAPKLRVIRCDQTLWDAIEWGSSDGQDIKLIFESFLVLVDD